MARGLKFRIYKVEGLYYLKFRIYNVEGSYYLCSENKGADQLHGYREADLRLCFRSAKCWFSHDAAQITVLLFQLVVAIPE